MIVSTKAQARFAGSRFVESRKGLRKYKPRELGKCNVQKKIITNYPRNRHLQQYIAIFPRNMYHPHRNYYKLIPLAEFSLISYFFCKYLIHGSPCTPAEARRWIFLIFRKETWKIWREIWREFSGIFSDPQNKGSKISGKFRSIFRNKIP